MRITIIAATCGMLVSSTALAAVSGQDKAFLDKDVQGGRFELVIARLAMTKATKPQIRSYSSRVVSDHEKANAALMKLVRDEGVQAPAGISKDDSQTLDQLKGLSGTAFDKAYVDNIIKINAEDEQTSKQEVKSTHDAKIKAYIAQFSKTDKAHKDMGDALKPLVG